MAKWSAVFLCLTGVWVLETGCTSMSYKNAMTEIRPAYATGDFDAALAVTEKKADAHTDSLNDSALLWQLNHASVLRAAGKTEQAEQSWELAQPMFEKAWENERVHLVRDALGMVVPGTGDTAYYGSSYDGVMLYTYRALNAMQMGDMDEARRFILCAMTFRDEVIEENRVRVEKRMAAVGRAGQKSDSDPDSSALTQAAISDGMDTSPQRDQLGPLKNDSFMAGNTLLTKIEEDRRAEEDALRMDLEGYTNYANPLTGFLTYLFLRTQGTGLIQTDRENVRRELQELGVFAAKNSVVSNALAQGTDIPLADSVFVIFETGMVPHQEEVRLEVPIPTKYISYLGVAYPRLVFNSDYVPALVVSDSAGHRVQTDLLANLDAIVKRVFDDEFPSVIAKQIAQAVVNAAVNTGLNMLAREMTKDISDPTAKLAVQFGTWAATAGLSYVMTDADVRSWELLPKQFQLARMDIPEDRKISLAFPDGGWQKDVTLDAGSVMVVLVKSTGTQQVEPLVSQFKLK